MTVRTVAVCLIAILAGCAQTEKPEAGVSSKPRISSTLGFSFAPPSGNDWIEEFGKSEITYLKKTDPDVVSFYAGALEGKVQKPLTDTGQLLAFVREKKDQWGTDGRYTEVSSSFLPDPQHRSCVRYRMKANDHGTVNRDTHEFLTLHTAGRFCTHPDYPDVVVDMYYSARHVPGYDASHLNAEGEAFINSLIFNAPLAQAGDKSG